MERRMLLINSKSPLDRPRLLRVYACSCITCRSSSYILYTIVVNIKYILLKFQLKLESTPDIKKGLFFAGTLCFIIFTTIYFCGLINFGPLSTIVTTGSLMLLSKLHLFNSAN